MYIEVLHDSSGNIAACYCVDTLPINDGAALFIVAEMPVGYEQARINIDTITAMEIEAASGLKAVIDLEMNQPVIRTIDRTHYIMETFKVDMGSDISPRAGSSVPKGIKIRELTRI